MRAGRNLAIVLWTVLALAWVLAPASAAEGKVLRGIALVIGNGDYDHLARLPNPPDDARAIEDLLSRLGFDTTLSSDRNARRLARDLEDFVEDAEGADVAVLYYAGHGIEAGGENYLVPVDADISSLDAAAEKLVPISDYVARLRRQAAVAIVLLDACRDSPFPADAVLRATQGGKPLPVAAGGLAVAATRGATPLSARAAPPAGDDGLGTVIGFAAEPGKVALDGTPDGHSPYAAALLKHLGALEGAEFGTVMRMVAEEVYLETGGRQRPWVNESLRRLLYFGAPAPQVEEGEAAILVERRELLVRIADLPDVQRNQAQTLARSGNVPMSVVFAMMRALDVAPGEDPETVESRLRSQIAQFAAARSARDSLSSPDPEIQRLSRLADEAELQGALNAADGFRQQAKQRVTSLRPTRQRQAEELRQRIREDAEVFARSAETKKLLFQHLDAASDYEEAHDIVAEWDPGQAAEYRRNQIDAYLIDAELRGAEASLAHAEKLARAAAGAAADPRLDHALGLALLLRGIRSADVPALREAAGVLAQAAAAAGALPPSERARMAIDAGRATGQLAIVAGDPASFATAERFFGEAAGLARGASDKAAEAEAMFRTFQAQYLQWAASPDQRLFEAMRRQVAALEELYGTADVDDFSGRYIVKSAAMALDLAARMNTPAALASAGGMVDFTRQMFSRERYPLIYAEVMTAENRLGLEWAERFGDPAHLQAALDAGRQAVAIYTEAGYAGAAADALFQQALTLASIGQQEPGTARLEEALAAIDAVEKTTPRAPTDAQKRAVSYQRGRIGAAIALRNGDADALGKAIADLRTLLDASPAAADPQFHVQVRSELGKASYWLGNAAGDLDLLASGADLLAGAVDQYRAWGAAAANTIPYGDLLQQYSGAASSLALARGRPADLDRAIAATAELHDVAHMLGNAHIGAVAGNDSAWFMVHRLREGFDAALYARAESFVQEAAAMAASMPDYAGHFANTACELRTEKARHEADAALARAALDDCQSALGLLEKTGQPLPMETGRAAVARAAALVEQLGGR